MSTLRTSLLAALLSMLFFSPTSAPAYYDPGTQRWLNRDPLADIGSCAYKAGTQRGLSKDSSNDIAFQSFRARRLEEGQTGNLFYFLGNSPPGRRDPFGLDHLPNTSSLNCFQNCLADKRAAPGFGSALKHHAVWHAAGLIGFGACGCLAAAQGFCNLIVDLGAVSFGAFETYHLVGTIRETTELENKAKGHFARCLTDCARQWHDWDGAYEFWEMYK